MRVADGKPSRKARLKAACALAGISIPQFAVSEGITPQHLYAVLDENDPRESARLVAAVDAFIEKQFAAQS